MKQGSCYCKKRSLLTSCEKIQQRSKESQWNPRITSCLRRNLAISNQLQISLKIAHLGTNWKLLWITNQPRSVQKALSCWWCRNFLKNIIKFLVVLGFPGLNDHSLLALSSLSPPLFPSLSHKFSLTHILSLPLFSHTFSPPLTLSHHTGYPIPNSGIHLNVFSSLQRRAHKIFHAEHVPPLSPMVISCSYGTNNHQSLHQWQSQTLHSVYNQLSAPFSPPINCTATPFALR